MLQFYFLVYVFYLYVGFKWTLLNKVKVQNYDTVCFYIRRVHNKNANSSDRKNVQININFFLIQNHKLSPFKVVKTMRYENNRGNI